ncbi:MAG: hypothetical protein WDN09_01020 [bacterium]
MGIEGSLNSSEKKEDPINKERPSWKERAGKVLRLSGVPIAFAVFLASCGNKDHMPSGEILKNLKEKGAPAISTADISALTAIIQQAKASGKTEIRFENHEGDIEIDTVDSYHAHDYISLGESNKMNYGGVEYTMGNQIRFDDKTIHYLEFLANSNLTGVTVVEFDADRESGVIIAATVDVDEGESSEAYGVDENGSIIGRSEVGKKAQEDFADTVKKIKERMDSQK